MEKLRLRIPFIIALISIIGFTTACSDFLTPSMDQEESTDEAIKSIDDLNAIIRGANARLLSGSAYGQTYIIIPELRSDNAWSNARSGRFVTDDMVSYTTSAGVPYGIWNSFYQVIAQTNYAIQSAEKFSASAEVDHIKGQALALRALAHMNLIMNFGQQFVNGGDPANGIPYIMEYGGEEQFPAREPTVEVWTKIGKDFEDALDLLDQTKFSPTSINYWATKALQTRYFLYTEQFDKIAAPALDIINSGQFSIIKAADYVDTWNNGIPGSLFELGVTNTTRLGSGSVGYVYLQTNYGDVSVSDDLYDAYTPGDTRLDLFELDVSRQAIGSDFWRMTGKFTSELGEDNIPIIRYAEVILNYAEALAQDPTTEAQALDLLTEITSERNKPAYAAGTVENVLKERRLELAMEGHRWYDLIRTGTDVEIGDSRSFRTEIIEAGDFRMAMPIPENERSTNSNMTQNKGYVN